MDRLYKAILSSFLTILSWETYTNQGFITIW